MNQRQKLLIVDDDLELCRLLEEWLCQEGFDVTACYDVQKAREELSNCLPDILILDVMLPDGNGLSLLKTVHIEYPALPVLMLSARGEPMDRILGLELGADDYLPKPCDPRELTARLRAILRRHHPQEIQPSKILTLGDMTLNTTTGQVQVGEQITTLTITEANILEALLQAATSNEPLSKDHLSQIALGRKLTMYDRSLDMHISNLRKKLGNHMDDRPRIINIRGRGYVYTA